MLNLQKMLNEIAKQRTAKMSVLIVLFFFLSVFQAGAVPNWGEIGEFGLSDPYFYTHDDYIVIQLRSVEQQSDQDDSWSDNDGDEPHTVSVNGKVVCKLYYDIDGDANGYISSTDTEEDVAVEYANNNDEHIDIKIHESYFEGGQNTIALAGVWKERVGGGDDHWTDISETRTISYPKPGAATNLSASTDQYGEVTLEWNKPSTSVSRVKVYRYDNGHEDNTIDVKEISWVDDQQYTEDVFYEVVYEYNWCEPVAGDQRYIQSEFGSITPPAPPEPDVPSGVDATTGRCDGIINVNWEYNDSEVDDVQFKVYRNGSSIATLGGDKRSYKDNVGDHKSYDYTVKTIGPLSNSNQSSSATGTTSGPPTQPSYLNAYKNTNTIDLNWDYSNHANKYLLKRTSSSNTVTFEISDPSNTSQTDNQVEGCVTYTYQLFAANRCTEQEGMTGIEAADKPQARLQPDLSSYITYFDASKAYFPDKVVLEWEVESDNLSLVDEFVIERRKAGSGNAFTSIATVSSQASFEDQNAIGGVLYEYRITANSQCENDILPSNSLQEVGFRKPYGVVSGNVSYENGVNVKGAEILAEKSASAIGTSLHFDGSGSVSIPDNEKLTPDQFISVEAWIKSETTSGTASVIDKESGNNGYRIYRDGEDLVFGVNIDNSWQTVTASNVITAGDYTHVAGVVDSTGLKIYINGEVPYSTTYKLESNDTTYLADMGVKSGVISLMDGMVENTYSDFNSFENGLIAAVDSGQAQRLIPLLSPVVTEKEKNAGTTVTPLSGTIQHNSGDLIIGNNFQGNIDEIRIWNKARDEEQILFDYKRVVGNSAAGIGGYWRCDENFGSHIYDVSKSNGEFHKNDGSFSGGVSWSADIPPKDLLGWMGKTDKKGNYTIPYVPYLGSGENFTLTPRYKQHQFDPNSKSVFLGEGSAVANGQNFTDISSFKVTGRVTYENTYCGVEGVIIGIDGEPVIKDGQPVYTGQNGEFTISVPVGEHYINVQKTRHDFRSAKFPPGPNSITYDFQGPISGINFIDETEITVTGRVVGGTREGDKKPGLGLATNNIGVAEFDLEAATGCTSYHITTDSLTGEYSVDIPPMTYQIKNFGVPKNPAVANYFNNEFPEADFSMVKPEQTVSHTYSGAVDATIAIDTLNRTATMDIDGEDSVIAIDTVELINDGSTARYYYEGDAYQYAVDTDSTVTVVETQLEGNNKTDSATFNYRYDLIYRTKPQIRVTASDSVSSFTGESIVQYEDPVSNTQKEFNVEKYPLNYPVFEQGSDYSLIVHAEEIYYNQDMCPGINGCAEAKTDRVPVNDGSVNVNNQLAINTNPGPISLAGGKTRYSFRGGEPQILTDANFPWRDYTSVLNITVNIDGTGYEWKPIEHKDSLNFNYPLSSLHPDDKYFRGYVLGPNPIEGSDFVTNGPKVVDMILRDPPGSESYSYLEKGTSISYEKSLSTSSEFSNSMNVSIQLGPSFEVGMGYTTETDVNSGLDIGFSSTTSTTNEQSLMQEYTTTESWETSDSPELAGTPSDLFMGSSKNYTVSLADNLTVLPSSFADSTGLPTAGKDAGGYQIALNRSLMAAPEGDPTHFIYTADHIENYLIPNLIALRNNLFINNAAYTSNIERNHTLYGTNNDDPRWEEQATTEDEVNTDKTKDYDGPSYTFIPPDSTEVNGKMVPTTQDKIRDYNQQIQLWRDALERNEMEKYHARLVKNVSFDAGPTFEHSTETALTQSHTTTFESNINVEALAQLGGTIGGIGVEISNGISFDYSTGKTTTQTSTQTNTFGYVLHDPDQGDYFSVDVKDAGTGTGPVFVKQGGRSMCPCEEATSLDYYQPTKHEITGNVLNVLNERNAEENLRALLSRSEQTGKYNFSEIKDEFPVAEEVKEVIPDDAIIQVQQIKDRQFENKLELAVAVESMIDLHLDMTLSENEGLDTDISDNMESMTQSDIQKMSDQMEMDGTNAMSKIYLFSEELRNELKKEWSRYRKFIYEVSGTPLEDVESIGTSTIRREVPTIGITPNIRTNVPDDNKAYFTLQLGNNSYTNEEMEYTAQILESSNPDGAVIKIDGDKVNRSFSIDGGQQINKTLSVAMGKPDVYEYDSLRIVFYSPCENEFDGNGRPIDPEAIDTVSFSVHFVPSCTNITIGQPDDEFIINAEDQHLVDGVKQTKVPILLSGYDLNNNIFEKLNFQFKSEANTEWIIPQDATFQLVASEDDQREIPGDYTALEWDLSGYPDGEYNIRAKTYCGSNGEGSQIFDLSEVWTGVVDRKPPKVFGTPQPADGILAPDDDIMIEFNEEIFGEKLTEQANFDIRGILNGTDLRHDVSVQFDGNIENFVRIPDGINLAGKSFTVEFWLKTQRSHVDETILSQGSDPENTLAVRLNEEGKMEFQVGDETYTEDGTSTADIVGEWHHWAFVYDNVREEAIVMKDGQPLGAGTIQPEYTGYGDVYIGKSIINDDQPVKGSLHELRVWELARTASDVTANMLITLSGKETGLIGYWPFDDADGKLAVEKVHKRNATVNTSWNITPSGYAATFNSGSNGMMDMEFSDVIFTPEEDFTIEFWFKSSDRANSCFLSNGHGDESDLTLYYISPEGLANIAHVLPLEDSVKQRLQPAVNKIFADEANFLDEVKQHFGDSVTNQYSEQILRFGKHMPTYWSINTDGSGNIQVSNNGKRIKTNGGEFFDNQWHHFALVVDRTGNTRVFVDGEMKVSEPSTEWNGFGAARLFVGARGLFDQQISGYTFDQFFNGKMDELRIWNSALKQNQIERNNTMRLDGDELGLMAYFPFESYDNVMGASVIEGLTEDVLNTDRGVNTTAGMFTQKSDAPNIRMTRPSSKVDFSFVAKEDKVAFTINEPDAKVENCNLDITVKNVEDMHGNKMTSPVTWSAYVDRNQVKWKDQQFNLEKQLYEPLTFSTKIMNNSGEQQNYSIENLPGWLSVSPRDGTLEPLTEQKITFTVNKGTNVGNYSKDINLKTDFDFDEKLLVNLRVFQQLPDDWEVEAGDYQNSMNIIGLTKINQVISTDKNDKVAAFVDGECRGIANLKYISEYDMYEVFLDVYSNSNSGEYFELHIWDASTGREYKEVSAESLVEAPEQYDTQYEFIDNTVYGSPSSPIELSTNSTVIKKMPIEKGWNWKSFNVSLDRSKPLGNLLNGVTFKTGDMIKGMTSYSEFANYWVGTLNYPEPEQMYMFEVGDKDTLKVSGIPVDPSTTPISIVEGWNWIGFTPQINININDALGQFNPNHGDLIKSQFAFSMYDELMGWVGTLEFLRPNQGYKYKYMPNGSGPDNQVLYYPEMGSMLKSSKADDEEPDPTISTWNEYPNNMSLVATVEGVEQEEQDEIYAYDGDELRGKASPIRLENGQLLYFMTLYGHQDKESLSFVYNHKDQTYRLNEEIQFDPTTVRGSTDKPFVFSFNGENNTNGIPEEMALYAYPNPFDDEFTVSVKQPDNKTMHLRMFDSVGKTVKTLSGLNGNIITKTINASDLESGVYVIEIKAGNKKAHYTIIKK